MHPECEAFALTPIAAHSLAFRPIIASPNAPLGIEVVRANEGTTLVLDGQLTWTLQAGDTVRIRRGKRKLKLVHDPEREFWADRRQQDAVGDRAELPRSMTVRGTVPFDD